MLVVHSMSVATIDCYVCRLTMFWTGSILTCIVVFMLCMHVFGVSKRFLFLFFHNVFSLSIDVEAVQIKLSLNFFFSISCIIEK